jgi:type IV pilus assembly protein PilM
VLIFAMPREEITGSYGMIAGYGSRVAAAEPGILASAAALESAGLIPPGKFIGILDIGFKHSTLALVIDGKIRFVRSFSIAGETLTQNIMHYCKLGRDEAEAQKCLIGLPKVGAIEENPTETALQVGHALSLSVEQLATELDHSLRYVTYYSLGRGKGGTMEKLYLAGGGALLKNLPGFLESRLDTRVELADPFRALPVSDAARAKLIAPEPRARLTAALGLALREHRGMAKPSEEMAARSERAGPGAGPR